MWLLYGLWDHPGYEPSANKTERGRQGERDGNERRRKEKKARKHKENKNGGKKIQRHFLRGICSISSKQSATDVLENFSFICDCLIIISVTLPYYQKI